MPRNWVAAKRISVEYVLKRIGVTVSKKSAPIKSYVRLSATEDGRLMGVPEDL